MNKISHHLNITLVCVNTLGLTAYCTFRPIGATSLTFLPPFLLALAPTPNNPTLIRALYCLISILALASAFLPNQSISVLAASVALGLSLNLGYMLTNQIQPFQNLLTVRLYEGALNLSIALGVLLSKLGTIGEFTAKSAKLLVLTTTLANFYLPTSSEREKHPAQHDVKSKVGFALVPFYMETWTYSIGYAIGVYLNTFGILSPSKHAKYLVIGLLILIEVLTYKEEVKMVSELVRAVLVYHFERHTKTVEMLFVLVFLILRLHFHEDSLNFYLIVGYVSLAVSIWRSQYREFQYSEEQESELQRDNQIEMRLLRNMGPSLPSESLKLKSSASRRLD